MKSIKVDGYKFVRVDDRGLFFYQVFLGRDAEGKQHFKKSRRDAKGQFFTSAKAAEESAMRVKVEFMNHHADDLKRLSYGQFMVKHFLPKYRGDVEDSTWGSHKRLFMIAIDRFENKAVDRPGRLKQELVALW